MPVLGSDLTSVLLGSSATLIVPALGMCGHETMKSCKYHRSTPTNLKGLRRKSLRVVEVMAGIGLVRRLRKKTPGSYCAHLYYTRKQMYEWRFYFVITRDVEAMYTVVREHYGHDARQDATMPVRFEHSEITLDISSEGLLTWEDWRITPLTAPTISRKDVDECKRGQRIPECQLFVQWEREDQRPVPLRHRVNLIGAKAPHNFIYLTLNPAVEGFSQVGQQMPVSITSASGPIQPDLGRKYAGLESEPELSDLMNEVASKIPAKWKDISIQLGLTLGDLKYFMASTPNDPLQCFTSVFRVWKNRATRLYTWSTVIEALESPPVDEKRLAEELRTKLQSVGGFSQFAQQMPISITSASGPIQPGLAQKYAGLESEPELSELMNEVASKVSAKWKHISIQLGLTPSDQDSFADATGDNAMKCFALVFNAWKSRATRPYTWSTMIEVLNTPAVAEFRLAQELRTKFQSAGGETSTGVAGRKRVQLDGTEQGEAEGGRDPVRQISSDERVIDGDIVINKKAIGSGAFGSVFKGRLGGQPCAVKILHPHALQLFTSLETTVQQEALQKFREECKILERFRHPNVVRHLSSRTDPRSNLPVLVMELMDESLTRFLEKPSTALSLFTEASLSFDIASALQFLHSENIVHHDLCSDNVLLLHTEQTPIAKISDFGMSRILDPDQCRSLTTLGHREAHLPPEARKIASKEYDASLDIFSFGVVVVQIVTKSSKVARAADRDALVEQIEATHPLCSLVHDCIRVEKEMRPNANDVCHDLESKVENLKTL